MKIAADIVLETGDDNKEDTGRLIFSATHFAGL